MNQPYDPVTRAKLETTTLIERHGVSWLLDRFNAGALSEELLREMFRDTLFRPLLGFKRHARLRPIRHPHLDSCSGGDVTYAAAALPGFTVERLDMSYLKRLGQLNAAAGCIRASYEIAVRAHFGQCSACDTRERRLSALVTVFFGGFELSREYSLEAP
jgi:hypothetical protein